jgi:hypothetical protein
VTTTIGERAPGSRWAYGNGRFPDLLYAAALLALALGVVQFPLRAPLFRAGAARGEATAPPEEPWDTLLL